ncbi:MAG: hypothetical protein ACE5E1_02530 [Phycisphaerae bacterium]
MPAAARQSAKRTRSRPLAVTIVVLSGLAGACWWYAAGADSRKPLQGWPEHVSMTCEACGLTFQIPSEAYVKAVATVEDGKSLPLTCPGCGGRAVQRTDHMNRPERRFGLHRRAADK